MANLETKLENLAAAALYDLKSWGGIENITKEQVLRVINSDNNREYYIIEVTECCGYEKDNGYGLDTCVRETVFDDIAMYFIGEMWPANCDRRDFEKFHSDLIEAIEADKMVVL